MRTLPFFLAAACATACDGGSSPLRTPEAIATLPASAMQLLLDGDSLYIAGDAGLLHVPRTGGTPTMLASLQLYTLHLAGDAFYARSHGELVRIPRAGGVAEPLTSGAEIPYFTIDGDRLLWTSNATGLEDAILTRPVAGDASVVPTVLLQGGILTDGGPIATDDARIFVAQNETFGTTILSAAKDGSHVFALSEDDVSGLGGVFALHPHGDHVFFLASTGGGSTSSSVKALPKAGGAQVYVGAASAEGQQGCRSHNALTTHGNRLYVSCLTRESAQLRYAKLGGESLQLVTMVELFFDDNPTGAHDNISAPVFADGEAYFVSGTTVYRVDLD